MTSVGDWQVFSQSQHVARSSQGHRSHITVASVIIVNSALGENPGIRQFLGKLSCRQCLCRILLASVQTNLAVGHITAVWAWRRCCVVWSCVALAGAKIGLVHCAMAVGSVSPSNFAVCLSMHSSGQLVYFSLNYTKCNIENLVKLNINLVSNYFEFR